MKKRIALLAGFLALFGGLFVLNQSTHALPTFATKDNGEILLEKDAVHQGSYYTAGNNITIDGTINGDLYCAGQNVKVNGTVNGDVLCAAQRITINGSVAQDVRSAGQIITVAGHVGGTVTAFGQDIEVMKGATVKGDLNGAGQSFTVDGTVGRDVAVAGQSLTISGLVKGSAVVNVESLSLSSKPAIVGSLDYTSTSSQDIAKGSVTGPVKFTQSQSDSQTSNHNIGALVAFLGFVGLSLLVTAVVLSLLVPRYLERSYALMRTKFGTTILVGIAVNLAVPIVAIALLFTVVGISLSILIVLSLIVVQILAFPFAAYYLSRALFGQVIHNVVLLMLAGAALLLILMVIPIVNIFAIMFALVFGAGALVMTVVNGYQKPTYTTVEPTRSKK